MDQHHSTILITYNFDPSFMILCKSYWGNNVNYGAKTKIEQTDSFMQFHVTSFWKQFTL